VRAALGIAPDALVIGHVGRFVTPKNHPLLIEIAAQAVAAEPRTVLLLVGDGPLRPEVEQQARQAGLQERVIFAGSRPDVARLLRGAIDVFVLPSHYEGLGLAGVEAQAAGLPCLFSNRVPPEADVVAALVRRRSLAEPPEVWAQAALAAGRRAAPIAPAAALAAVRQHGFDSVEGARRLERLYYAEVSRGRRP
jgi:glycosyltransferase involved in cell wall biosynthesis